MIGLTRAVFDPEAVGDESVIIGGITLRREARGGCGRGRGRGRPRCSGY
jgi:hypothetical protein